MATLLGESDVARLAAQSMLQSSGIARQAPEAMAAEPAIPLSVLRQLMVEGTSPDEQPQRSQQQPAPVEAEPDDWGGAIDTAKHILAETGSRALGAFGTFADWVSLPSSSVMDVLRLENPFDQWLDPHNPEKRSTGRDVLDSWGVTSENMEGGMADWWSHPGEAFKDIAGFAFETALDPLNMLAAPIKAASATAKLRPGIRAAKSVRGGVRGWLKEIAEATAQHGFRGMWKGRGKLRNVFDPLRLEELGYHLNIRSSYLPTGERVVGDYGGIRKALWKAGDKLSEAKHWADTVDVPIIKPAARAASRAVDISASVYDAARVAARAAFDWRVQSSMKKETQELVTPLSERMMDMENAIRAQSMVWQRRFEGTMKQLHGDDIFDKIDANEVVWERAFREQDIGFRKAFKETTASVLEDVLDENALNTLGVESVDELVESVARPMEEGVLQAIKAGDTDAVEESVGQMLQSVSDMLQNAPTSSPADTLENAFRAASPKRGRVSPDVFAEEAEAGGWAVEIAERSGENVKRRSRKVVGVEHDELGVRVERYGKEANNTYRVFVKSADGADWVPIGDSGRVRDSVFKGFGNAVEVAVQIARKRQPEPVTATVLNPGIASGIAEALYGAWDNLAEVAKGRIEMHGATFTRRDLQREVMALQEGVEDFPFQFLDPGDPEVRSLIEDIKPVETDIERLNEWGVRSGVLRDVVDFAHRYQGEELEATMRAARGEGDKLTASGPERMFSGVGDSITSRDPAYLGWYNGTNAILDFYESPVLRDTVDAIKHIDAGYMEGRTLMSTVDELLGVMEQHGADMKTTAELRNAIRNAADTVNTIDIDTVEKTLETAFDSLPRTRWKIAGAGGGRGAAFRMIDIAMPSYGLAKPNYITAPRVVGAKNLLDTDKITDLGFEIIGKDESTRAAVYAKVREEFGPRLESLHGADRAAEIMEHLDAAEEAGLPLIVQKKKTAKGDEEIIRLAVPEMERSGAQAVRRRLTNIRKLSAATATDDPELLATTQRELVAEAIRRNFGSEYIEEVPKIHPEFHGHYFEDYRIIDGVRHTGNTVRTSRDELMELLEKGEATFDLAEARSQGLFYIPHESRTQLLTDKVLAPDGLYNVVRRTGALFGNDRVVDNMIGALNLKRLTVQLDGMVNLLDDFIRRADADPDVYRYPLAKQIEDIGPEEVTIGRILEAEERAGSLNAKKFLKRLALGPGADSGDALTAAEKLRIEEIARTKIDSDIYRDVRDALRMSLGDPKGDVFPIWKSTLDIYDGYMRLWKTGMLSKTSRIVRDLTSAFIQLTTTELLRADKEGLRSLKLGSALATSDATRAVGYSDLLKNEAFADMFRRSKMADLVDNTPGPPIPGKMTEDEAVFEFFRIWYTNKLGGAYRHSQMDIADPLFETLNAGTMDEMFNSIPNAEGGGVADVLKQEYAAAKETGKASLNPLNMSGIPQYFGVPKTVRGTKRKKTQFVIAKMFDRLGEMSDAVTRSAGVIDQIRSGMRPDDAFRIVSEALVDYDPRKFTALERSVFRRVLPFYSFTRGMLKWFPQEMMRRPAGPTSKLTNIIGRGEDDEWVPFHMRNKPAIRLSRSEDGTEKYLSGLGLMHEDAVGTLAQPSVSDVLQQVAPPLRVPWELTLGRSTFMRGPLGGKDLSEMDPPVGRIVQEVMENVGLREDTDARPVSPIGATAEHLLSNSPISRALQTARTMLDDRKSWPEFALIHTTGLKTHDVSLEAQHYGIRGEVDAREKEVGIRPFVRYTLREEDVDRLRRAGMDEEAEQLLKLERARDILDKARRKRKKLMEASGL